MSITDTDSYEYRGAIFANPRRQCNVLNEGVYHRKRRKVNTLAML